MESLFEILVQNGLGVASFGALIFFIFKYEDKQSNVLEKISTTLTQCQITLAQTQQTLATLTDRVDKIENIIKKEK